jgi:iron complex outermembrane receptor protein
VLVTSRRVLEDVQDVPIPVTVLSGVQVNESGAFNVNRLKELIPSVQFYSSNPRNSSVNIRGLGAPFGLTNDGIEPGVGFYVDGIFYARPASATADFLDIQQIEVLRGPQGTLYGKNTTAGAINITTRRPSFTPDSDFELTYGNYGFVQAKGSISGPLTEHLAGRISFSGTQRDGLIHNVRTDDDVNDLNNLGFRAQLLYQPSENFEILLTADKTRQRPEGYAQVIAGVAPTLRPANRQWAQIIADLNYTPPSYNAFDRLTDTDTPWRSNQDLGGASATINWIVGPGTLTSITAWRFWDWDPSNDRDFIGLPITTLSQATSKQRQWTQEIRYAGEISPSLNFVVGVFGFRQSIESDPIQKQEQGSAAARFLLAPSANAATPGLLDGYGQNVTLDYDNDSAALFGQLEWSVTERLRVLPGVRLNYDRKEAFYDAQIYGGLQTSNAALIALQRSTLAPQTYTVDADDTNVTGQLTIAYQATDWINAYATYATGKKSVGVNLGGVPTDALGNPILSAATVKPEDTRHIEFGIKTEPFDGVRANLTYFNTEIEDYQTQVVNAQVGVLRGYLANAEKVRVQGFEFDGAAQIRSNLSLYGSVAYTEGVYVSFLDAPAPLEGTGGPQAVDASGTRLPGISKWAAAVGAEYFLPGQTFLGVSGDYFVGVDLSYRSSFSSNPTVSQYLNIDAYSLVNARIGFQGANGWDVFLWARNLFDTEYYELLSAAPGGSGLIVGLPGDPRTFGITLRRRT